MPKFKNIKVPRMKGGKKVGTRLQRVQVLKSGKLKFVKNKPRGGGQSKSAAKKPTRKRSKSVAKKSNPGNKSPKIGAAIQAFKGTQPLVSPVIAVGVRRGFTQEAATRLRGKANISYAGNVIMSGVNNVIDRKIAQGAALSRGSATAWLAEGIGALGVVDEVKGQSGRKAVLAVNRKISQTLNAYNPDSGRQDFTDPAFRTYQAAKIVGGGVRRVSNMGPFKKIFAPVKKFLGEMGGAL